VTGNNEPWPSGELESLGHCPICGAVESEPLYSGLVDHAFRCAGGSWSLSRCGQCRSAYLDPRPTEQSIKLAYSDYYTHRAQSALESLESSDSISAWISRSYLNHQYGHRFQKGIFSGWILARVLPFHRSLLDAGLARHLPKAGGRRCRLLDVGCGSGEFLEFAGNAGWSVVGVDLDPLAAIVANRRGLDVIQASTGMLPFADQSFEAVTLGHVVEHVHDPTRVLRECFRVLVPGGRLWLETPNIESLGHRLFRWSWRGLEPPRHLVVFSQRGVKRILAMAGFVDVAFRFHGLVTRDMWPASRLIAERDGSVRSWSQRRRIGAGRIGRAFAEAIGGTCPRLREFITCVAMRP